MGSLRPLCRVRPSLPSPQLIRVPKIRDPEKPPTSDQLAEASKIRRRLMDSFAQYDVAARRIRDLPTNSPIQQRLQKAVYQQATNFLHLHMLPLKTLPKILKHASPSGANGGAANGRQSSPSSRPSALASIRYNDLEMGSSQASNSSHNNSTTTVNSSSINVSAMEEEERSLRERLIVLEEQKYLVDGMLATARKRRRFDEVTSLTQNVRDLNEEIESMNRQIGRLDFATLYESTNSITGR